MIDKKENKNLEPNRRVALELANVVSTICDRYNMKYTFIGDALLS